MPSRTTIGVLDTLVTLQAVTTTQEATFGSRADVVTTLGDEWASVAHASESEGQAAGANQRQATHRADVRIRWRADVDATCRVVIDGTTYVINGAVPSGRRQWLDLSCSAFDNHTT